MEVVCYHDKVLNVLLTEEDKRIKIFDEEAETTFEQAKIVWEDRFKKYLVDAPPTFDVTQEIVSAANTAMYDISGYLLAIIVPDKLNENELTFFNKGLSRLAWIQDLELEDGLNILVKYFGSIENLEDKLHDSMEIVTVPSDLEFYDNEDKLSKYYLLLMEVLDEHGELSENPDYDLLDLLHDYEATYVSDSSEEEVEEEEEAEEEVDWDEEDEEEE